MKDNISAALICIGFYSAIAFGCYIANSPMPLFFLLLHPRIKTNE